MGGQTQVFPNRTERPLRRRRRGSDGSIASKIFLAFYLAAIFIPLLMILIWAFVDAWPWPLLFPESLSLRGFEQVTNDKSDFIETLLLTVGIAIATSLVTTTIAVMAARALVQHFFRGKEIFRFGIILPFLIPETVFAMGVQTLFLQIGLANSIIGVIVAHCVIALPYATTIMIDVTAAAGDRLEEQARVLGAGTGNLLLRITIPTLLPGILSAATLAYIISIGRYFITMLVGGGKVTTVMMTMFPFLSGGDRTIASSYAVFFLLASFVVFLLFEMILKRFRANADREYFL